MEPSAERFRERLRWRSRRGLLEMDLILQRFLEQHLPNLSAVEVAVYDCMLDLPDNDFLDLAMGRKEPDDPSWLEVLTKIRQA